MLLLYTYSTFFAHGFVHMGVMTQHLICNIHYNNSEHKTPLYCFSTDAFAWPCATLWKHVYFNHTCVTDSMYCLQDCQINTLCIAGTFLFHVLISYKYTPTSFSTCLRNYVTKTPDTPNWITCLHLFIVFTNIFQHCNQHMSISFESGSPNASHVRKVIDKHVYFTIDNTGAVWAKGVS